MNRALVVGGSLGGLFAGLLLRQAGWDVTVFERTTGDLSSRGAGVGTHPEQLAIMRRIGVELDASIGVPITSRICLGLDGRVVATLPFGKVMSSWTRLYRALRGMLPDAVYRQGMQLDAVEQDADRVTAVFADGSRVDGDLLVGADGLRSAVRAACFDPIEPSYAGYVAWRGVRPESAMPALVRETILDQSAFFLPPREMVMSYPVPGRDDETTPGKRGFNWLWYHPVHATAKLPGMCTDASGRVHAISIPPPLIRPEVIASFREEVAAMLPPPLCGGDFSDAGAVFSADFRFGASADRLRAGGADWGCGLRRSAACGGGGEQGGAERGVADGRAGGCGRGCWGRAGGVRGAGAAVWVGAGRAGALDWGVS